MEAPGRALKLDPIKSIKKAPAEEYYQSGHRTCQGCLSALPMRLMAKAAGPRTIVLGTTGCMYVANTTYMSTPWVVPWMHTQLGASGSAAVGTSAGLKALMRKGKMKDEPINVIAFCGDGGGADMGLAAISAALTDVEYNLLIFLYDNESYANTDIQTSGQTPWGAVTTFSPPGKKHRIMQRRWKKNVPGMLAAGHPDTKYIASGTPAIPVDMMDKVREALSVGGPTYMHVLDPCPKGWHYDPEHSTDMAKPAIEPGSSRPNEIKKDCLNPTGVTKQFAEGKCVSKPVGEKLEKQAPSA